ncbi:MAG TPA: MauE/DoxX family redox-associated membrane protein [Pseudonocardiaceae bacterium]|nr:MauE/DoxX family redox-associated membrane protein [Pseudonocardiaceae bacterium]
MVADYGVWIARLLLCVVFGLSAWGKLTDRSGARTAVAEFGIPARYVGVVAWALPSLEVALAVGLLPGATAPWAGLAVLLLLGVFTAAVARLLRLGRRPACSCFGSASEDPIGGATIVRNAALMAVAVVVVWGGVRRPQVPGTLPTDHAVALAVVAIIAAMLVWLIGQVRVLRRQVDRQALSTLGGEGMPIGSVAPEFELADSHGGSTSLQQLLACGTSVVLVFVHPGCDICATLAGELPRWQHRLRDQLTIAVIANGDLTENLAWGRERGLGEIPMLVQQGNEAALRYRVRGTPSAVLVDADGRIAAPVARGPIAIRELFVSARVTIRGESSRFSHPTSR